MGILNSKKAEHVPLENEKDAENQGQGEKKDCFVESEKLQRFYPRLRNVVIAMIILYVVSILLELKWVLKHHHSSTGFKILLICSMAVCCGWIFASV